MTSSADRLREHLRAAGLGPQADTLITLGLPAVRLRSVADGMPEDPAYRVAAAGVEGVVQRAGTVAIAASVYSGHWLALLDDGGVAAWGENGRGQLGDGSRASSEEAVAVLDLDDVVAIAAGGTHSLALRADGSVLGWGDDEYGQLCSGTRGHVLRPAPVTGLDGGVRAVAAGAHNSFALLDDGSVVGWGLNAGGERLGIDAVPDAPFRIPGLESGLLCVSGAQLALRQDGSILAWGRRSAGGRGAGTDATYLPTPVAGLDQPAVAVAGGSGHSLALMQDGSVMCWGSNHSGELGHGVRSMEEVVPVRAKLAGPAVAIAAGMGCSFALLRDGSVAAWGFNFRGALGDGTTEARGTPVAVRGLDGPVRAVGTGAAVIEDRSLVRWSGMLPRPADASSDIAVGASRLGGLPDLPPDTRWPHREGRPLLFLAQVDLAEVAPHTEPGEGLPSAGLLSLFFDPGEIPRPDSWELVFTAAGTPLSRLPAPPRLAGDERLRAVRLVPERETSWLPPHSDVLHRLGLEWPQIAEYEEALDDEGERPIHRMLGHPMLLQPPDPRDADPALCLLLQVDFDDAANWMWGDVGCQHLWIRRDDLAASRFDRAVLEPQSA